VARSATFFIKQEMFYTNSQKCADTSVNYKLNPARVFKAQNGYAILCFGIKSVALQHF
jgi:hypothetical protein